MLLDLPLRVPALPANHYDVHAAVYGVMLRPDTDDVRDFLFTVLPDLGGMVVVRSSRFPDHFAPHGMPVEVPKDGEVRGFTLAAHPTRRKCIRRDVSSTRKSLREPLPPNDPMARIEWLAKKGRANGFNLNSVSVHSRPILVAPPRGRRFFIECAEFRGELTVTDAERLGHVMANGIGRGRAFGLGMLRWA